MQSMSILYTTNQCLPVNSLQTNIRSNFYNVPGNPNWETALMIREYHSTLEFNPLMERTRKKNIRSSFYNVPGNQNWKTALMIREYQSTLEFNPLMDGGSIDDHQIKVCVRKRPQGTQSERTRCVNIFQF